MRRRSRSRRARRTPIAAPPGGTASGVRIKGAGSAVAIRNNIIQTAGGAALVDSDYNYTGVKFNGNDYWSGGTGFRIKWGSSTYGSVGSWRSSVKQEMSGTT